MIVVVMGVAGVGKSTVGALLAERLGLPFLEADDEHSADNVTHMAAGLILTEEQREPWLTAVAGRMAAVAALSDAVLACSALRASHRQRLLEAAPDVRFVHLDVPRDTLLVRLALRTDHFFGPNGLDAQLAILELPAAALVLDGTRPFEELVDQIVSDVGGRRAS